MPVNQKYLHVSFAFLVEDKELLTYCAKQCGLTQTELIRRLLRNFAGGTPLVGITPIKTTKAAKAWIKDAVA